MTGTNECADFFKSNKLYNVEKIKKEKHTFSDDCLKDVIESWKSAGFETVSTDNISMIAIEDIPFAESEKEMINDEVNNLFKEYWELKKENTRLKKRLIIQNKIRKLFK